MNGPTLTEVQTVVLNSRPKRTTNGIKPTSSSGGGRTPLKPLNNRDTGKNTEKIDDLTLQVEELKMSIDGLEKERDFYFAKLRDIEVLKMSSGKNKIFNRRL